MFLCYFSFIDLLQCVINYVLRFEQGYSQQLLQARVSDVACDAQSSDFMQDARLLCCCTYRHYKALLKFQEHLQTGYRAELPKERRPRPASSQSRQGNPPFVKWRGC